MTIFLSVSLLALLRKYYWTDLYEQILADRS